MRIDTHTHLIPASYREELERRDLMIKMPSWSRELMDDFMDRYGVDAAVVSIPQSGVYFGDPGLARHLARLCNEETARLVGSDPSRFAGLAVLPLPDAAAAIEELDYALDVLNLDGVGLTSNVDGVYIGDARWDPVFDELNRRGAYVFVHPRMPKTPSPMPGVPIWVQEFPFDTTRAVVELIFSGTLARCPRIRFQLAHMGGCAPFLAHRIAELATREPDRLDATTDEVLGLMQRLYYDTGLSNNAPALAATRELVGIEQIVFGTDWPFATLPRGTDPAPGLRGLAGTDRGALETENSRALIPRWFR